MLHSKLHLNLMQKHVDVRHVGGISWSNVKNSTGWAQAPEHIDSRSLLGFGSQPLSLIYKKLCGNASLNSFPQGSYFVYLWTLERWQGRTYDAIQKWISSPVLYQLCFPKIGRKVPGRRQSLSSSLSAKVVPLYQHPFLLLLFVLPPKWIGD